MTNLVLRTCYSVNTAPATPVTATYPAPAENSAFCDHSAKILLLRALLALEAHTVFLNAPHVIDDFERDLLGLTDGHRFDNTDAARAFLCQSLKQAESEQSLFQNCTIMERLGFIIEKAKLDATQQAVLRLACYIQHHPVFKLIDSMSTHLLSQLRCESLYAHMLQLPVKDVAECLKEKSQLSRMKLIFRENEFCCSSFTTLRMPERLTHIVSERELQLDDLLAECATPVPAKTLKPEDFFWLEQTITDITNYLSQVKANGDTGINIMIHGKPGTGKTEFVRMLGSLLNLKSYEVATSNPVNQEPLNPMERLNAVYTATELLKDMPSLLVFDEAEDIFRGGLFKASVAERFKGWINRFFETNKQPTLWISNSTDSMEPSILRRFSLVLNFRQPPVEARKRLFNDLVQNTLPDTTVSALAKHKAVSPALLSNAFAVARLMVPAHDFPPPMSLSDVCAKPQPSSGSNAYRGDHADQISAKVVDIINEQLQAAGQPKVRIKQHSPELLPFDPAYINCASQDVTQLPAGIERTGSARLCIYGMPGTGKTQYANWLSKRLGRKVLVKKASDLLSKWVGDNERNVAAAFEQATRHNAILVIDEADTFLQTRESSNSRWERSLVNEFLTQMEAFEGILVCTTNDESALDPAALRRFDLKMEFKALTSEQATKLFQAACAHIGIEWESASGSAAQPAGLTPGDFAAVLRQHRFAPITSASQLQAVLREECRFKQPPSRKIGF